MILGKSVSICNHCHATSSPFSFVKSSQSHAGEHGFSHCSESRYGKSVKRLALFVLAKLTNFRLTNSGNGSALIIRSLEQLPVLPHLIFQVLEDRLAHEMANFLDHRVIQAIEDVGAVLASGSQTRLGKLL